MPTPNASCFWWGEGGATLAEMRASALWQIAAGLNTVTVTGGGYVTSVVDAVDDNVYLSRINDLREDEETLAAYNAKFGAAVGGTDVTEIPFTLQDSPGAYGGDWDGVEGDATSIRSTSLTFGTPPATIDSAATDFIETYHTYIQDLMDDNSITDLRDLVPLLTGWVGAIPPLWWRCPNYGLVGGAGKFHDNAMLRFEQHVKYIRPVHVSLDVEAWWTSALQNSDTLTLLGLSDALASCTRCLTRAGMEAGKDLFAKALIDKVHEHVPTATVTFYDAFSGKTNFTTELYGVTPWFNFSDCPSNSSITIGAPSLYSLSQQASPVEAIATFAAGDAPRYDDLPPYNEAPKVNTEASGLWWGLQPGALSGSYVWLTHTTQAAQLTGDFDGVIYGTYLTDDQFYDMCYELGRRGAVGFYLYPGYHGDLECPNDIAMNRLFPIGIQAFADAATFLVAQATPKPSGRTLRRRGIET